MNLAAPGRKGWLVESGSSVFAMTIANGPAADISGRMDL
jgi:hypothetical protein